MGARLIASSVALVIALSACGGGGDEPAEPREEEPTTSSFAGNGVTFEYPTDWVETTGEEINQFNGVSWSQAVGIDEANGVEVSAGEMPTPITAENLDANYTGLISGAGQVLALGQGQVEGTPADATVGGLPALRLDWSEGHLTGTPGVVKGVMYLVFDQTTEYVINCRADRSMYEAVLEGCEQIAETFEIESSAEPTVVPSETS